MAGVISESEPADAKILPTSVSTNNLRKRLSGLYYGWRMIGLVSALRVLGGGLHQYGFTVFFRP